MMTRSKIIDQFVGIFSQYAFDEGVIDDENAGDFTTESPWILEAFEHHDLVDHYPRLLKKVVEQINFYWFDWITDRADELEMQRDPYRYHGVSRSDFI